MILLTLVAARPMRSAGDGAIDRATLRGLKAVNVVADLLDPELENQGLTQDMLRARIEDRLQGTGIGIDRSAPEFLGLRITPMRGRKGPYSLYVSLALYQPVVLNRDRNIKTSTQTWETGMMLIVEQKVLVRSILGSVDQMVDQFLDAYRSVT
jgi:hypothetical protein